MHPTVDERKRAALIRVAGTRLQALEALGHTQEQVTACRRFFSADHAAKAGIAAGAGAALWGGARWLLPVLLKRGTVRNTAPSGFWRYLIAELLLTTAIPAIQKAIDAKGRFPRETTPTRPSRRWNFQDSFYRWLGLN